MLPADAPVIVPNVKPKFNATPFASKNDTPIVSFAISDKQRIPMTFERRRDSNLPSLAANKNASTRNKWPRNLNYMFTIECGEPVSSVPNKNNIEVSTRNVDRKGVTGKTEIHNFHLQLAYNRTLISYFMILK